MAMTRDNAVYQLEASILCHIHADMMEVLRTVGMVNYAADIPKAFKQYNELLAKTGMTLMSRTERDRLAGYVSVITARNKAAAATLFGAGAHSRINAD